MANRAVAAPASPDTAEDFTVCYRREMPGLAWYVDGFSPTEIARQLGADPAAVRQSLAKARKNLKHRLGVTGRCPR